VSRDEYFCKVHALVFLFLVDKKSNSNCQLPVPLLKLITAFENPSRNQLQNPKAAILTLRIHMGRRL
jgi:hypothetical protein